MTPHDVFVADFHSFRCADPNARVFLGLLDDLGALPDPSLAHAEAEVRQARALLRRLDALPPTDDFDEALDRDLARLCLQRDIEVRTRPLGDRPELAARPAGEALGDPLFLMMINDPRDAAERLEDCTARIEATPNWLEAALGRLDRPLERWVGIERQSLGGLPELFSTLSTWASEVSWSGKARLDAACESAAAAVTEYLGRLDGLPAARDLHVGDERARQIVRNSGIELDLGAIHQLATDFLAETDALIEDLRGTLVARYDLAPDTDAAALQEWLGQRFAVDLGGGGPDAVLARYEQERRKVLGFVTDGDRFPLPDDQDMTILNTPAFLTPSIPAGAMMPPPPFRPGTARSVIYLTLREELLAEHTELGIPMMMVHEGIPGHHLQLAWAARNPSVVRRHVDAPHPAEGWTTMLEDWMLDEGYAGDLADEVRFVTKRDLARIGARVAIDLFFMTGELGYLDVGIDFDRSSDDPFERAGALLTQVTGFVPPRVAAELNWYSQRRGYPLSYLVGNRLVWQLKRDVRAAWPDRDRSELDRAFHRSFLLAGNMPLTALRRVFTHDGLLGD